jgi:hypothetical protein
MEIVRDVHTRPVERVASKPMAGGSQTTDSIFNLLLVGSGHKLSPRQPALIISGDNSNYLNGFGLHRFSDAL